MSNEIMFALVGLITTILAAIIGVTAKRKKMEAEVEKFKAEAEKFRAEADEIRAKLETTHNHKNDKNVLGEYSSKIYYGNYSLMPSDYSVIKTLKYVAENVAELQVIGRTCFRWLCGDETLYESDRDVDQNIFRQNQAELQFQIREAVKFGSRIHFVLQNPNLTISSFNQEENKRLHKHVLASVASYDTIKSQIIEKDVSDRLIMSFSEVVVDNSMLRLLEQGKMTRFILDLSIGFKSNAQVFKPVLVFSTRNPECEEYVSEFEQLLTKSINLNEYHKERKKGSEKISALAHEYWHYSYQRDDKTEKLASIVASNYMGEFVPPVSVQLLLTHNCTTKCKMCDHYNLHVQLERKQIHELTTNEMIDILGYIHDIGTRSIILSGGEPLARPDFYKIIGQSKQLGLHIGLLTNGIKAHGESLTREEINNIVDACSWIQISIDSFEKETYKKIRGVDYLESVLASVKLLADISPTKVELCYTIQKDNILEVNNISTKLNEYNLPQSIPLRLKFAHGPVAGRGYLCSLSELEKLLSDIPSNGRINSAYLNSMINESYFDIKGISQGKPLENRMRFYSMDKTSTRTCKVLSLSCLIDPIGDVYPCCFLYDDNFAESRTRDIYRLGSIRARATGDRNPLASIWRDPRENGFRQHPLPVDENICCYCTRHFYQNEFMNKCFDLFNENALYGVAEEWANKKNEMLKEPLWL